jgi:flagellar biosynthesis component FlhA
VVAIKLRNTQIQLMLSLHTPLPHAPLQQLLLLPLLLLLHTLQKALLNLGSTRTIHMRCIYSIFGRDITHTVISGV